MPSVAHESLGNSESRLRTGVAVRRGFLYSWATSGKDSRERGDRPLSANERRTGRPVWIVARRAALLLIPLVLGVAATALLADSGSVRLPRVVGPGSHSSLPPTRSVVVPTQAFGGHSSQRPKAHVSHVSKPSTRA